MTIESLFVSFINTIQAVDALPAPTNAGLELPNEPAHP
jgi:hypothetical protein